MHKMKTKIFNSIIMLGIGVKEFIDAKVNTVTIVNRILYWIRMHDVQEGLCIKNISDLERNEIHGIFETKNPTKDQITEENGLLVMFKLKILEVN